MKTAEKQTHTPTPMNRTASELYRNAVTVSFCNGDAPFDAIAHGLNYCSDQFALGLATNALNRLKELVCELADCAEFAEAKAPSEIVQSRTVRQFLHWVAESNSPYVTTEVEDAAELIIASGVHNNWRGIEYPVIDGWEPEAELRCNITPEMFANSAVIQGVRMYPYSDSLGTRCYIRNALAATTRGEG